MVTPGLAVVVVVLGVTGWRSPRTGQAGRNVGATTMVDLA
jgi:hypothetical protein